MMRTTTTLLVISSAVFAAVHGGPAGPAPPTFASAYTATGFVLLPYANLREPFTATYDAQQKKSRIDYYDGMMKTFQIATQYTQTPASGAAFKIVWSPSRMTHVPENICYQANSTDKAPVKIQTVFPDLTGFKYVGEEDCSTNSSSTKDVIKGKCDKWTNNVVNVNRSNAYTFWAQKNGSKYVPARYVMLGYDSLFGSHFDLYEMIYTSLKEGAQDATQFDVVKVAPRGRCVAYPEGSGLSSDHLFNPMKEFVHHDESHLNEYFNDFKATHGKTYTSAKEEASRMNNFRHNQRFVNSLNRKNADFELRLNHLSDLTSEERKVLRGRKFVPGPNGGSAFPSEKYAVRDLPKEVDWRTVKGVVSPVKDQAICGSCWSFGTTGHLEAMYALKYNKSVRFSEQQLVDCSWAYGNGACDGGQDYQAYRYIIDYGLYTDDQYDPYLGIDGKCHDSRVSKDQLLVQTLLGYANVSGIADLKRAVAFVGPISVGIDAAHESFSFYHTGIFHDKECKNKPEDLDHAVLAVGYGSLNGTDYWIIKNSWSTHWGDDGYVKMEIGDNLCGVATAPTYAILP